MPTHHDTYRRRISHLQIVSSTPLQTIPTFKNYQKLNTYVPMSRSNIPVVPKHQALCSPTPASTQVQSVSAFSPTSFRFLICE